MSFVLDASVALLWLAPDTNATGVDYADIDAFGDHVVRNNVIRRCGEAGIAARPGQLARRPRCPHAALLPSPACRSGARGDDLARRARIQA